MCEFIGLYLIYNALYRTKTVIIEPGTGVAPFPIKIAASGRSFCHMASDWLAAVLPAN